MAPLRAFRLARSLKGACAGLFFAATLLAVVCSNAAFAQDASPTPAGLSEVSPPRDAVSEQYRETAQGDRIKTDARYVDEIDLKAYLNGREEIQPARPTRTPPPVRIEGGAGIFIVVALLVTLLFLWLKFGGTGALLSSEPKSTDGAVAAPESWKIGRDEAALDQGTLLDQIRAMPDRRAALVRLLRHALLAAGETSETRFARSDTEREAFARLPTQWHHRDVLALLLKAAELAHYGGRSVSEDAFERALDQGAAILGARGRQRNA